MAIEYVVYGENTFVVTDCAECGGPYSGRMGVSATMPVYDEDAEAEWNCLCGNMNEMKYHSDDCPCTLGGENLCELHDWFEAVDLDEEMPDRDPESPHNIVKRMFDRIHGRKCA
jgi:hypothetical protein